MFEKDKRLSSWRGGKRKQARQADKKKIQALLKRIGL